ncbi:metabolite traffic protein EboE [Catalinimonas alkaloidigena]|nr:metabolite traffic protein EboE [Catalinimonas alkaloidigena]
MRLSSDYHLTYCTNIHPGESWDDMAQTLRTYVPTIKAKLHQPFGIGLRLSDQASREILERDELPKFKTWLAEQHCYVFTMNGFPYGGFHRQRVKANVHKPDWRTRERVEYTLRLFRILAELLPEGIEGGISTSPISYKPWLTDADATEHAFRVGAEHLAEVAAELYRIRQQTGQVLHLDIEPEPDGLLENTQEVVDFFKGWLLPEGGAYLQKALGLTSQEAEQCLKDHIQLCYDVCHFALAYEAPANVFSTLRKEGIRIGKIQISAALKWFLPTDPVQRLTAAESLRPFVESTYLHQVVERTTSGALVQYPDLPEALDQLTKSDAVEWRTHFHVPIFLKSYGALSSTQEDIVAVLKLLKTQKVTRHLEVETYTWEVLPPEIRMSLAESIVRELQWVEETWQETSSATR